MENLCLSMAILAVVEMGLVLVKLMKHDRRLRDLEDKADDVDRYLGWTGDAEEGGR